MASSKVAVLFIVLFSQSPETSSAGLPGDGLAMTDVAPKPPNCIGGTNALYFLNQTNNSCQECPSCGPGHQPDRNCGEDGRGDGTVCVPCPNRHFSTTHDQLLCEPCRTECEHTIGNIQCTPTRDGSCGPCAEGFGYVDEAYRDQCVPCEELGLRLIISHNQKSCQTVTHTTLPLDVAYKSTRRTQMLSRATDSRTWPKLAAKDDANHAKREIHKEIKKPKSDESTTPYVAIIIIGVIVSVVVVGSVAALLVRSYRRRGSNSNNSVPNQAQRYDTIVHYTQINSTSNTTTVKVINVVDDELEDNEEGNYCNAHTQPTGDASSSIYETPENDKPVGSDDNSIPSGSQQERNPDHDQTELAVQSLQPLKI